jgi:hypothetical protein
MIQPYLSTVTAAIALFAGIFFTNRADASPDQKPSGGNVYQLVTGDDGPRVAEALLGVHDALDAGRQKALAMREAGVFGAREGLIGRALGRIDGRRARRALRAVSEIDRASKGLGTRDAWQLVVALCLGLSSAPPRTPRRAG